MYTPVLTVAVKMEKNEPARKSLLREDIVMENIKGVR
jgi:hypothetical protein